MLLRKNENEINSSHTIGQQMTRFIPSLRRYAWALLKHDRAADPDDLVQECLMYAWEKRDNFISGSDLRAWMFTILHNRYVSGVRRAATRQKYRRLMEPTLERGNETPSAEITGELATLQTALNSLPEEQRVVILLIALEGLSYQQVAKVVQAPIGTVRSRLSRGRDALRQAMEALN